MADMPPKKSDAQVSDLQEVELALAGADAIPAGIVKDQLARLVASPLFNRSDRYPAFLTYVV